MQSLFIGIDDTDSAEGMCTTYIAAVLVEALQEFWELKNVKLIRLNPNIKWKTRGNASVCIEVRGEDEDKIKEIALDTVKRLSAFDDEKTNPGVIFYRGEPSVFNKFYYKCLREIATIEEAENLAKKHGAEVYKFKSGRGIVGALASIGSNLADRTYEIIAYRERKNWGRKRRVDPESVRLADAKTFPLTFNNIDFASSRILITPNSPCPVLFGIRGESIEAVKSAFEVVRANEKIERTVIFETNQCTDAHLSSIENIAEALPARSVILRGRAVKKPEIIKGGHVIFSMTDGRDTIDCAAYEPTREFRWIVNKLIPGDEVAAYGSVREDRRTLNLEKIKILKLARRYVERNPVCKKCGYRMESAGKGQGYRCRKCKTHGGEKIKIESDRELEERMYSVPPNAMRHLSKPLVRTGPVA